MLNERSKALLSRPSLSVKQLAELLGISLGGAYDACERGEIACVRIGRRYVIPTPPIRKMLMVDEGRLDEQAAA